MIEYRLRARDGDGNETVYPEYSLPMFRFEVFAFSGEPVLYVAMRHSNAVSVFDTGFEKEVARIFSGGDGPLSVVLSKDGKRLFASDPFDANVLVVDLEQNQVVSVVPVGGLSTRGLAISEDGRLIYVTNQDSNDLGVTTSFV